MPSPVEIVPDSARSAYISLAQAARLLPPGRRGRPVHVATLHRWITSGTRTADGGVVRLRAVRLGSRWVTTAAWLLDDYGFIRVKRAPLSH